MNYFASDVHLGLQLNDPAEREERFVSWLKSLPRVRGDKLYLLGDIWDFWYEYKHVVPKNGIRVVAQLIDLMDNGMEVTFLPGNHDIWTFRFFEEIGIRVVHNQPMVVDCDGKRVMIAHGDGLGKTKWSYRLMLNIFHSGFCQALFSAIHPSLAFRWANGWSHSNRRTHKPYVWKGENEPLYQYAQKQGGVDVFIFGHYHCGVDQTLPNGARLVVLKDWIDGGTPCFTL